MIRTQLLFNHFWPILNTVLWENFSLPSLGVTIKKDLQFYISGLYVISVEVHFVPKLISLYFLTKLQNRRLKNCWKARKASILHNDNDPFAQPRMYSIDSKDMYLLSGLSDGTRVKSHGLAVGFYFHRCPVVVNFISVCAALTIKPHC